jgi:hypothetical protein
MGSLEWRAEASGGLSGFCPSALLAAARFDKYPLPADGALPGEVAKEGIEDSFDEAVPVKAAKLLCSALLAGESRIVLKSDHCEPQRQQNVFEKALRLPSSAKSMARVRRFGHDSYGHNNLCPVSEARSIMP